MQTMMKILDDDNSDTNSITTLDFMPKTSDNIEMKVPCITVHSSLKTVLHEDHTCISGNKTH